MGRFGALPPRRTVLTIQKKVYHGETRRALSHTEKMGDERKAAGEDRVDRIGFKPYPMDITHAYSDFACTNLSAACP
jgi:hypothetical protein